MHIKARQILQKGKHGQANGGGIIALNLFDKLRGSGGDGFSAFAPGEQLLGEAVNGGINRGHG